MTTVEIGAVVGRVGNIDVQNIHIIPDNHLISARCQGKLNVLPAQRFQNGKNLRVQPLPPI